MDSNLFQGSKLVPMNMNRVVKLLTDPHSVSILRISKISLIDAENVCFYHWHLRATCGAAGLNNSTQLNLFANHII